MATKDLKARLKLKYDLYANWITNDPVLLAGEAAIAVVPAETGAVVQEPCTLIKIGDGTKKFSQLPFVSGLAADVYTWAKAATKPAYTADEISGLDAYISGKVQDTNTTYKIEVDATNPRKFQLYKHELSEAAGTWNAVGEPITIPVSTLVTGATNGTVKFNGTDVKVHGLGSAAYKDEGAFDAAGAATTALDNAKTYADGKDAAIAAAKKAGTDAQADVDALEELVGTLPDGATATTVVGYVDEKVGAIPAQTDYTVTVTASTPEGVAKRYNIKQAATSLDVNIDIPKDMVVKSGTVETKAAAGDWGAAGTYLHLVLANATEDDIYINVDSLIEYVTGGTPADGIITTSVSDDFVLTATINNGTITKEKLVTAVQTSLGKADSALQKADIKTGTANGNISVDGTDVPVAGLKDAAYATVASLNTTAKGYADAVLGATTDGADKNTVYGVKASVTALTGVVDNKIDATAVSEIGKTGNINDILQTEGDYIVFDCGNSSTMVGAL